MLFAIKAADDVMIDSVAMAIGANHAGSQVDIFVVHPTRLDAGLRHGAVAVALVTRITWRLANQVHEHRSVWQRTATAS